jgi:hypothetical protein
MSDSKRWPRGWRGAVTLVIGVFMGATLITPAVAHVGGTVGHLWFQHIRSRVINLGDPRWINTGEAAGGDLSGTHADLQINADAVGSAEIAGGAVGSSEIADGAVRYADLDVAAWTFNSVSVANNTVAFVLAGCPAGRVAISGGAAWDVTAAGTNILLSRPSFDGAGDATSWRVDGHNTSGATRQLVAFVLCIQK